MNIFTSQATPERVTALPVPLPFERPKTLAEVLSMPAQDLQLWQRELETLSCRIHQLEQKERLPVILSYGMGVDSSVIFFKYLFDPEWRDFNLQDLVLVIAMLGSEWEETHASVLKWVLPLARLFGVRVIQAGRAGESALDGIVILDDTRHPVRLYTEGAYKLRDSLIFNGTVPQVAKGRRLCTQKFKGWVIDAVVRQLFGDSPARRLIGYNADEKKRAAANEGYTGERACRYVIGYNADETSRMSEVDVKQGYRYILGFNGDETGRVVSEVDNKRKQVFQFTLIEKGWGRDRCEAYLWELVGEKWEKSFCRECCFPMCSGSREGVEARFLIHPDAAFDAAEVEVNALAINPTQLLYGRNETVPEVLKRTGNTAALQLLDDYFHEWQNWAVYVVRRLFPHDQGVVRQTKIIHRGDQQAVLASLHNLAHVYELEAEYMQYAWRFWTLPPAFLQTRRKALPWREELFKRHKRLRPSCEEMFVACPARVVERQGDITEQEFSQRWRGVSGSFPSVRAIENIQAS